MSIGITLSDKMAEGQLVGTLRDIQMEHLSKLKKESYDELLMRAPGFEYFDERFMPRQHIRISILKQDNIICVRSIAFDVPLSPDKQAEMEMLFGKNDAIQTLSIEWHDGFNIDESGNIANLHAEGFDD